jgi:putative ABC transport system permease protein
LLGIYGAMSYTVAQPTREIGIRMALGAQRVHVARMVVTKALQLTLAGVTIGLLGASAAGRRVSSLLFAVQPFDTALLLTTAAILVGSALAASGDPALRALRVDPIVAFGHD